MKSAVLVIDVQNGVFGEGSNLFESTDVVERIKIITEHAKKSGDLVIYVQHEAPGIVDYGSDAWQLHPRLAPETQDIKIRKISPDAFLNTDLNEVLQNHKINSIVVCGYSSDFCIDRTTFKAASTGYTVRLIEDAHTTHDKPHLSAQKIRTHHNFILSKHPKISLVSTADFING